MNVRITVSAALRKRLVATAAVVSLNLRRRHLSEGQRAWVAAKLADLKPGRPEDNSANMRSSTAAELLNVSTRSVENARVVRDHGVPELQANLPEPGADERE